MSDSLAPQPFPRYYGPGAPPQGIVVSEGREGTPSSTIAVPSGTRFEATTKAGIVAITPSGEEKLVQKELLGVPSAPKEPLRASPFDFGGKEIDLRRGLITEKQREEYGIAERAYRGRREVGFPALGGGVVWESQLPYPASYVPEEYALRTFEKAGYKVGGYSKLGGGSVVSLTKEPVATFFSVEKMEGEKPKEAVKEGGYFQNVYGLGVGEQLGSAFTFVERGEEAFSKQLAKDYPLPFLREPYQVIAEAPRQLTYLGESIFQLFKVPKTEQQRAYSKEAAGTLLGVYAISEVPVLAAAIPAYTFVTGKPSEAIKQSIWGLPFLPRAAKQIKAFKAEKTVFDIGTSLRRGAEVVTGERPLIPRPLAYKEISIFSVFGKTPASAIKVKGGSLFERRLEFKREDVTSIGLGAEAALPKYVREAPRAYGKGRIERTPLAPSGGLFERPMEFKPHEAEGVTIGVVKPKKQLEFLVPPFEGKGESLFVSTFKARKPLKPFTFGKLPPKSVSPNIFTETKTKYGEVQLTRKQTTPFVKARFFYDFRLYDKPILTAISGKAPFLGFKPGSREATTYNYTPAFAASLWVGVRGKIMEKPKWVYANLFSTKEAGVTRARELIRPYELLTPAYRLKERTREKERELYGYGGTPAFTERAVARQKITPFARTIARTLELTKLKEPIFEPPKPKEKEEQRFRLPFLSTELLYEERKKKRKAKKEKRLKRKRMWLPQADPLSLLESQAKYGFAATKLPALTRKERKKFSKRLFSFAQRFPTAIVKEKRKGGFKKLFT